MANTASVCSLGAKGSGAAHKPPRLFHTNAVVARGVRDAGAAASRLFFATGGQREVESHSAQVDREAQTCWAAERLLALALKESLCPCPGGWERLTCGAGVCVISNSPSGFCTADIGEKIGRA